MKELKILYLLNGGEYGLDKEYCVFSFDLKEQGRKAVIE